MINKKEKAKRKASKIEKTAKKIKKEDKREIETHLHHPPHLLRVHHKDPDRGKREKKERRKKRKNNKNQRLTYHSQCLKQPQSVQ